MIKSQKENSIKLVKEILLDNKMCVVINYKGLDAETVSKLRMSLKDKKANLKVFKNTLFKRAVKDTEFGFLDQFLFDQIAISYSQDPISLSNIIDNFVKEGAKIEIKTVAMDGKQNDISIIKQMAGLGSIEDIRAKFIGVLKGAGSKLVGVLESYTKKLEA